MQLLITDVPIWLRVAVQGTNEQVRNENQNYFRFQSVNTLSRCQKQQISLTLRHVDELSSGVFFQQLNTFNNDSRF